MTFDRRQFVQLGALSLLAPAATAAATPVLGRHRARALGITIGHLPPGPLNAITDVAGVEVGHTTIISGHGKLEIGVGPVRTGVTAIWPQRNIVHEFLPCGVDVPNGNGEFSGMLAARNLGILNSPICLTTTSSVGMVHDALQKLQPVDDLPSGTPVVGETWDDILNDGVGRHVHEKHVLEALAAARGGPVAEGSVGGGTGMTCYEYKGGIGTASRVIEQGGSRHTVGVLVQANHGLRYLLRIDGVPVGAELSRQSPAEPRSELNSALMIIATDAPLLAHQLQRLARRATHGLARTGSISSNSSGDFTLAFSTANRIPREAFYRGRGYALQSVEQFHIFPYLEAASEAVEEAIINALCMAEDMTGINGNFVPALPLTETLEILRRHGRLSGGANG
ncbi:MAG: P1 family peptidase [Proteobacteria bacterium]|nr:P1 family peptidase [Pseudomonadota bacterium]MDA1063014.1 P1 family peptidase [Pseudomonadota bacterium]